MFKSKKIICLLMVFVLMLSIVGCAKEDESTSLNSDNAQSSQNDNSLNDDSSEVVEIQFLQWWGTEGDVGVSIDGLVADFEKEHPNIKVKVISLPFGDTKSQIIANHASGTIADVVGLNPPWTREFVDLGILEPLDEYMEKDTNFNKENYFPASMEPINGKTYLAPYNTLSFFLYYNKDLFNQAGLEEPKTWDDIINASNVLTDVDKNQYGFTLSLSEGGASNGSILSLYPLLYAANGRTYKDGKYTVESEEMIAAMNLLKTLSENGSIVPGENVKNDAMMVEEFSLGNIGMMIQNDAHVATIAAKNPDLNYGVIPIPTINGTGKPDLRHHGWDLGMTVKGKNKEEAWEFISFLLEKENMERAGLEMKKTPSMYGLEVSDEASEQEILIREYLNDYEMVEELMAMPSSSACWTELTKAGINVLKGNLSVEEALAECQKEWDNILQQ